jgi:hypothetical protein
MLTSFLHDCRWFYAVIVVCKLVFLHENERLGRTQLEDIPEEINNMIPENAETSLQNPTSVDHANDSGWDAMTVAREYDVQRLFERFMAKMRFVQPEGNAPWSKPKCERESLYSIGCIQQIMLHGFTKRIGRLASGNLTSHTDIDQSIFHPGTAPNGLGYDSSTSAACQPPPLGAAGMQGAAFNPMGLPFTNFMNFDSINFDGVTLPSSSLPPQASQEILGDFMWDMVMDDFTMPSM